MSFIIVTVVFQVLSGIQPETDNDYRLFIFQRILNQQVTLYHEFSIIYQRFFRREKKNGPFFSFGNFHHVYGACTSVRGRYTNFSEQSRVLLTFTHSDLCCRPNRIHHTFKNPPTIHLYCGNIVYLIFFSHLKINK